MPAISKKEQKIKDEIKAIKILLVEKFFEDGHADISKEHLIKDYRDYITRENDGDESEQNKMSDDDILEFIYEDYIPFENWERLQEES